MVTTNNILDEKFYINKNDLLDLIELVSYLLN